MQNVSYCTLGLHHAITKPAKQSVASTSWTACPQFTAIFYKNRTTVATTRTSCGNPYGGRWKRWCIHFIVLIYWRIYETKRVTLCAEESCKLIDTAVIISKADINIRPNEYTPQATQWTQSSHGLYANDISMENLLGFSVPPTKSPNKTNTYCSRWVNHGIDTAAILRISASDGYANIANPLSGNMQFIGRAFYASFYKLVGRWSI